MKVKMVFRSSATLATFQVVGSPDPVLGDFPAAMGLAPVQGVLQSSGSGVPLIAPARRRRRGPVGFLCNFAFILELSLRTQASRNAQSWSELDIIRVIECVSTPFDTN